MNLPKIKISKPGTKTLIGGVLGGVPGALIGSSLDRSDKDREKRKEQKAQQDAATASGTQETLNNYFMNPSGGFSLFGNPDEKAYQAANLSQVGAMTGQNIYDIGRDATQYRNLLQQRLSGADPVAQFMMEGRNRAQANVGRQMAGRGVAGGVAAASMNQAQREADSGIAAQMFENQRINQRDLDALVTKNQKFTGNALAAGSDRGLADNINTNAGTGITLICTELKRQGLLPDEVQAADHAYGQYMLINHPTIMDGYHVIAKPIVNLMAKSKVFTSMVAFFAIPWAYRIAGYFSPIGSFVNMVGTPICFIIGALRGMYRGVNAWQTL